MKKRSARIKNEETTTENEIRHAIGKRIAEERRKLRISALTIAGRIGVSREAITHIETGRNNISAVTLWKIATLLKCDVGVFFPDIPDGYALTKLDTRKIELEGGEQAARWAKTLFSKPTS